MIKFIYEKSFFLLLLPNKEVIFNFNLLYIQFIFIKFIIKQTIFIINN